MKIFWSILFFGLIAQAQATPDIIEVWSLSTDIEATLLNLKSYKNLAQNNHYQCTKVGEYCFDPQIGMYDPKKIEDSEIVEIPHAIYDEEIKEIEKNAPENEDLSTLDLLKRDRFHCDSTNYFDQFCGQATDHKITKSSLDVYIDITESMSRLDSVDIQQECYRSSFARRLMQSCGNVSVYVFNDELDRIQDPTAACQAKAITDDSLLIRWIKRSRAKRLIIITDRTEAHKKFMDYAFQERAIFIGNDAKKVLYPENLPSRVEKIKKYCTN
ncbi:MAG: hypothetical protein H6621_13255 [Halobacteriovoraceae bacterium]|nr:hypothetical protein [Halobacteriovoraceae bacterium]